MKNTRNFLKEDGLCSYEIGYGLNTLSMAVKDKKIFFEKNDAKFLLAFILDLLKGYDLLMQEKKSDEPSLSVSTDGIRIIGR